jgi:hypothetical protein
MTLTMKRLFLAAAAAIAIAAPASHAQIVLGDQIVAQSNYVSRQQAAIPQVSIIVRADFVLFSVVTDGDLLGRRARDRTRHGVQDSDRPRRPSRRRASKLQPGISAAVETVAIKAIQDQGDDRSAIDVVLKVSVKERDVRPNHARAEKFVMMRC